MQAVEAFDSPIDLKLELLILECPLDLKADDAKLASAFAQALLHDLLEPLVFFGVKVAKGQFL